MSSISFSIINYLFIKPGINCSRFGNKNIIEIIKELLFSSHANIHSPAVTDKEADTKRAADGQEEEEDDEEEVDPLLVPVTEDPVPVEHIDVPVCRYDCC